MVRTRHESLRRSGTAVLAAAVGLLLATACADRSIAPAAELCVATWNIRWFPSGQPEPANAAAEQQAIDIAAREVRRAEPHILCVQEVRDRQTVEALARRSGLKGLRLAVCTDFQPSNESVSPQQVAILSNLPVLETATQRWHARGMVDPPRGYAHAVFETPQGPVAVFAVHLKSNYVPEGQDAERQATLNRLKRELAAEQLRAAVRRIRTRAASPVARVIVAGDFNTSLDDPRWDGESTLRDFVAEGYRWCFEGLPPTRTRTLAANAFHPAATFDHVWHLGFAGQRATRVHAKRWVSDHRLVSVTLTGKCSDIGPDAAP